jgi:hypothetical protein
MRTGSTQASAKAIVDEVLGRGKTREIWTGNYEKVLPISVQAFDLSAVLPGVFFMFRFGKRRGKGRFLDAFGNGSVAGANRRKAATIDGVAAKLAAAPAFTGFEDDTTKAILGDLLLCFCLENTKKALGRNEKIQRVAPAHYLASWVDLPEAVSHLRYVPEMVVAMLADQDGQHIQNNQEGDRTWFAVGRGFENNVLLRAFHQGVVRESSLGDRKADRFREEFPVGLDQLLMIRLAERLGEAPDKLRGGDGGENISNQRPVAEDAARYFSEDIRSFVRAYAEVMPRHAFVEILEACMAVGLTTVLTSVIEILFVWSQTGRIPEKQLQHPAYLFVDCSNGVERNLRALAEQSMEDFTRRTERFPLILMALRLLDLGARSDPKLRRLNVSTRPRAADWINLLGALLRKEREEAGPVLDDWERRSNELADRLREEYPEASEMLENNSAEANPIWRLAEALTMLQGRKNAQDNATKLLDSAMLSGAPNGLAARRAVTRRGADGGAPRRRDLRRLVFTDAVLDYLAHRHVLRSGNKVGFKPLALREFLRILHDRYGFCVDQTPPGMAISNEILMRNRAILERRLRDLGLLIGVNDAEAMKRLRPRFQQPEEEDRDANH